MIEEEKDLRALRELASPLRHEPDADMLARIRANVRARVAAPASPWDILAGWLRPATVSFAAIVLLFALLLSLAPGTLTPADVAEATGQILFNREVALDGR